MPLQNSLAVFDHLGMPAEVGHRVAGIEFPMIRIFPQNIIRAPDFPRPIGVIPWPAYRWNVFEPRQFLVKLAQFLPFSPHMSAYLRSTSSARPVSPFHFSSSQARLTVGTYFSHGA